MSKFDSLRPVLNMLETFLTSHGVDKSRADTIVFGRNYFTSKYFIYVTDLDIAERLVTAGYGWDKILQYHSKVCLMSTENYFNN